MRKFSKDTIYFYFQLTIVWHSIFVKEKKKIQVETHELLRISDAKKEEYKIWFYPKFFRNMSESLSLYF